MAIAGDIEWKTESAILSVLSDSVDLAGIRKIRSYDATPLLADQYPAIMVRAMAEDEEWAVRQYYTNVTLDIMAFTYTREDTTGSEVKDIVGAIRDVIYDTSFLVDMTGAVVGYHVFGAQVSEPLRVSDDDRVRMRSIVVQIHCTGTDIG